MQATCPNTGCGAVYTIDPEHVGHRSVCKKCGATFVIESGGLRLATDVPVPAALAATAIRRGGRPASGTNKGGWAGLLQDPFTWLMIAGSLLVIIFLFQPVLDTFKISRIRAELESETEDTPTRRIMAPSRLMDSSSDRGGPSPESTTVKDLRDDLKDARIGAKKALYVYAWFVMFGFILLALAEIGYLVTGVSKAKRVVGAILLTAQLLIIFIAYIAISIGASFRF